MEAIPLKTVRPFLMDSVLLSKTGLHHLDDKAVDRYLAEKVRMLIAQATTKFEGNTKLPLIRLKVSCTGICLTCVC